MKVKYTKVEPVGFKRGDVVKGPTGNIYMVNEKQPHGLYSAMRLATGLSDTQGGYYSTHYDLDECVLVNATLCIEEA